MYTCEVIKEDSCPTSSLAPSHPSHLVAFEAQLEREAVETVTPVSAQGVDVDAFGR